jgi:hypothetical protein
MVRQEATVVAVADRVTAVVLVVATQVADQVVVQEVHTSIPQQDQIVTTSAHK